MEKFKNIIGEYNKRDKHFDFAFFSKLSYYTPLELNTKKDKKANLTLLGNVYINLKEGVFDEFFFKDAHLNRIKCEIAISKIEKAFFNDNYKQSLEYFLNNAKENNIDEDSLDLIESYLICFFGFISYILLHLHSYCPTYILHKEIFEKINEYEDNKVIDIQNEKIDKRISQKAPTNIEKIKALKELLPDLWSKFQLANGTNRDVAIEIIHTITGCNTEDANKFVYGSRQSKILNTSLPELEKLKFFLKK